MGILYLLGKFVATILGYLYMICLYGYMTISLKAVKAIN